MASRGPREGRTPREWDDVDGHAQLADAVAGSKVGLLAPSVARVPGCSARSSPSCSSAPEGARDSCSISLAARDRRDLARAVHAASDDVMPFEPFEIPAGLGGRERRRREKLRRNAARRTRAPAVRCSPRSPRRCLPPPCEGEGAREAVETSVLCPRARAWRDDGGPLLEHLPGVQRLGCGGQVGGRERWLQRTASRRGEVERSHRLLDSTRRAPHHRPVTRRSVADRSRRTRYLRRGRVHRGERLARPRAHGRGTMRDERECTCPSAPLSAPGTSIGGARAGARRRRSTATC